MTRHFLKVIDSDAVQFCGGNDGCGNCCNKMADSFVLNKKKTNNV